MLFRSGGADYRVRRGGWECLVSAVEVDLMVRLPRFASLCLDVLDTDKHRREARKVSAWATRKFLASSAASDSILEASRRLVAAIFASLRARKSF